MEIVDQIENSNGKKHLIIAFDAKRLFNNFTGLGNYSRTLVRNLQHFYPEHEYHLFTPKVTINDETQYFMDSEKFIIHRPKGWSPVWRTFGLGEAINDLRPDIFHGLSHEIPLFIKESIKKVVTFHDLIYEIYPEQFGKIDRYFYNLKYRFSVKKADTIIAISNSTKEDLVKIYDIDSEKIRVVYQSCNNAFQINEEEDTSIIEPNDYFLYVGSIIERKSLLNIVFAYEKLEDRFRKKVIVIGSGDKKYRKKIDQMIQYLQLEAYFIFVKSVNNADLVSYYDNAYALIYPSVYEGFGIPVIEALFRNKPVITSYLSSLPEACGPGGLKIDPLDPLAIAQAIIEIQDKTIYTSLQKSGYQYVINNFSSSETAENLMGLYMELLEH